MTHRLHQLRVELDRARGFAIYARRLLERAQDESDESYQARRTISKLSDDLKTAERDAAWAVLQLEDALV